LGFLEFLGALFVEEVIPWQQGNSSVSWPRCSVRMWPGTAASRVQTSQPAYEAEGDGCGDGEGVGRKSHGVKRNQIVAGLVGTLVVGVGARLANAGQPPACWCESSVPLAASSALTPPFRRLIFYKNAQVWSSDHRGILQRCIERPIKTVSSDRRTVPWLVSINYPKEKERCSRRFRVPHLKSTHGRRAPR